MIMVCVKCISPHCQCVFDVDSQKGLTLVEIADGVGVESIRAATGCAFEVYIAYLLTFFVTPAVLCSYRYQRH